MTGRRRAVTAVLLTFVVFTAGYAVGKEVGARRALAHGPQDDATTAAAPTAGDPVWQLQAIYFHSTKRCATCNTMEAFGKEAFETKFADALASGAIVWTTANMDDVWNQDAVRRYGLIRSSLVLADLKDGEERDYTVLDRTWDLTGDKALFVAYVESEVEMMIDGRMDASDDTEE